MKIIKTSDVVQNPNLFDPQKPPAQLIKIECKKCGNIDKPLKWNVRWIFGIAYLFTILNVFGLLIYFVFTNPYICGKCGERNKLVKILNNNKGIPINCLSKNVFLGISIFFLVVGILIFILFRM